MSKKIIQRLCDLRYLVLFISVQDDSHIIRVDPEQPSKQTCLTMLKKRPYLICPCCREKLDTSPSEWRKHYHTPDSDLTDCNTLLAWRQKDDIRGWQPLLIKGILVPSRTAHMTTPVIKSTPSTLVYHSLAGLQG